MIIKTHSLADFVIENNRIVYSPRGASSRYLGCWLATREPIAPPAANARRHWQIIPLSRILIGDISPLRRGNPQNTLCGATPSSGEASVGLETRRLSVDLVIYRSSKENRML